MLGSVSGFIDLVGAGTIPKVHNVLMACRKGGVNEKSNSLIQTAGGALVCLAVRFWPVYTQVLSSPSRGRGLGEVLVSGCFRCVCI